MKILFRVYRRYFDQFLDGTKQIELRPMSKYWVTRGRSAAKAMSAGERVIGIVVCGRDRLEGDIAGIEENAEAVRVLGRALSEQGVRDLGGVNPRVVVFRFAGRLYPRLEDGGPWRQGDTRH